MPASQQKVAFAAAARYDDLKLLEYCLRLIATAEKTFASFDDRDTVFVANGLGLDTARIQTGAGADTVTVRNETADRLEIDAGAGGDTVDVRASVFDRLFALLGDDDDRSKPRKQRVLCNHLENSVVITEFSR